MTGAQPPGAGRLDTVIIGGGPGGLFTAILLRLARPAATVRVIEANPPGETFGFGVAFHEATLRKIAEADPVFLDRLRGILHPWDDIAMHIRGAQFRVPGHAFAGCSRHRLLDLLQRRAVELGVQIDYGRTAALAEVAQADLIVAADGASSRCRAQLAAALSPVVIQRPNRYVWLSTTRPMAEMNFFFRERGGGLFVAHAYPHDDGLGTWIVETDEQTFLDAGLDVADEQTTVTLMEAVFAGDLAGAPLIARDSFWRRFPSIRCARWTAGNVVLVGDAKATVHYSIGSGTKIAMEDGYALVQAITASPTLADGLASYDAQRRPEVELLQRRALSSMHWFETLRAHWPMPPAQFAFSSVTRKTDETLESIGQRAPALAAAAVASYLGPAAEAGTRVLDRPVTIAGGTLTRRRVAIAAGRPGSADLAVVDPPLTASTAGRLAVAGIRIVLADLSGYGDLSAAEAGAAAAAAFDAVRAQWAGPVGVRVRPPAEPAAYLPLARALRARGCALVAVAAGNANSATAAVTSDYLRNGCGLTTLCEGAGSLDEAETLLVSGRADLVTLSS